MTPCSGGNSGKKDALQGNMKVYKVYQNIKSPLEQGVEEISGKREGVSLWV